jgi:hypothetical protein
MMIPNQSTGIIHTAIYGRGLQRGYVVPAQLTLVRTPPISGRAGFGFQAEPVSCKCPCCFVIGGDTLVCC